MSSVATDEIIRLDAGFTRIEKEGILPFLDLIENSNSQFFKAAEFVKLYDLVFKMCIQRDPYNWSESMYERYTHAILNYLQKTADPLLKKATLNNYDAQLLIEWKTRWANQKYVVIGLSKLFMYLDRFYTPNTDGILPLNQQGYKAYKEKIFDVYSSYARTAILNSIDKERESEEQDRHLLKDATTVFVEMGYNFENKKLQIYTDQLEKYIVEHAGQYYQRKSRQWMDQDSCPIYLEKAEKALAAEKQRVEAYLNRATLEPLHRECYHQLLKVHQKELLAKKTGLSHLLTVNATEDLSRLYRLYKHEKNDEDLVPIAETFQDHIKKVGTEVVDKARAPPAAAAGGGEKGEEKGEEKEEKKEGNASAAVDANHALVRNLIALHAQFHEVVSVCFEKAQIMQKALKKAFEEFINSDNRVSKLLAKFVNDVLKKGTKVSVKDMESTLDEVVFLYGYIQEKDVFERDYQIFLANRLLMGLCESEHSEKAMIAKLKTEAGYQWTNKLEGMFKDVQLSKDLMVNYKKMYAAGGGGAVGTAAAAAEPEVQLEVNVCTTGYWPSSKIFPCLMPKDLVSACEKYKRFYLNQHSGHKLEWRYDQGQAELSVDFAPNCRKGLVCSTYQMMILLVFNTIKIVTYKQILDLTGIPKYEIANHLLSLAHPKVTVILKKPNSKKLLDTDQFMLNKQYKNQLKKVNIPLLRAVETEEGSEEENKAIELQRRHQMDAAIVRIMKTRKQLKHALLTAEVMQQLSARFKPKPNDIKKRIEALIEQEYMKRDEADRALYTYLA